MKESNTWDKLVKHTWAELEAMGVTFNELADMSVQTGCI